jgi:hypothetical protein
VTAGYPDAATPSLKVVPTVPVEVTAESVTIGAWLITKLVERVRVPDPVVAVMVIGKDPVCVGVPATRPLLVSVTPVGSEPVVRE